MAGQFINTQYKNTIDSLVEGLKNKLNNPYYLFTDKKACIVDYYNRNITKSTLDEGTANVQAILGTNSPTKYNLIKDAYLYGIERITVNWSNDDYGLESDPIEGDAIVLPNTFTPYPDDYFIIKHSDKDILFRVVSVNTDTLDNGANMYKLEYKLDRTDSSDIKDLVDEEYRMIINNVGTNFKSVIRSTQYDLIEKLDDITLTLKKYFKSLYFNDKVQSFTYKITEDYFYDPYMIEFLIRNKILNGDTEYTHVSHQTPVGKTFAIDYDRTFFRAIETIDKKKVQDYCEAMGFAIEDKNSLMYYRYETYYKVEYNHPENYMNYIITPLEADVIDNIMEYKHFRPGDKREIYNIIIDYLNNKPFDSEMINMIDRMDLFPGMHTFYVIPLVIYILEYYIKNMLK